MNTEERTLMNERIAQIRQESGLSPIAFARRIDVPVMYIEAIEHSCKHSILPIPVETDFIYDEFCPDILEKVSKHFDLRVDEPVSPRRNANRGEPEWSVSFTSTISRQSILDEISLAIEALESTRSSTAMNQLLADYVITPISCKLKLYLEYLQSSGDRETLQSLSRDITRIISGKVRL